jgi:hypothetical protein
MCKCACFDWFKKMFGLKKNCCCSSEAKKEVKVDEGATPSAPQESVVETPTEGRVENFEQK